MKVCVIIPTHLEKLDGNNLKSFLQTLRVFKNRDIKVVIPDNINDDFFKQYNVEIIKVNHEWMSSYAMYNEMSCKMEFYELFKDYDYILKCETDAWVFEDRLDYFMGLGYDWYGAPWPHHRNAVGNSGLSLRKVSKMIELTTKYQYRRGDSFLGNEDTWFCLTHKNELNACPLEVAVKFSLECRIPLYKPMVDGIPMGFHGKESFIYWDSDGSKFRRI